MWARVARFEGDPATLDVRIDRLRALLESGEPPPELAGARIMMLVDRLTGTALGMTLFETEAAMRAADIVMNAGAGHAGARSAVHFYEVPIQVDVPRPGDAPI